MLRAWQLCLVITPPILLAHNSWILGLSNEVYDFSVIQLPLVIVDLSTITSNSTIAGEIHAKIDNRSTLTENSTITRYTIMRGDCSYICL